MPCLLILLTLLFPRVVLAVLFLFTNYLTRAFHGALLVLILGFIFLPLTTLVYAWMINSGLPIEGINLIWLIIAAVVDLGMIGGGYGHQRSRA